MNSKVRKLSVAFAVFLAGTVFALNASAQCAATEGQIASEAASNMMARSILLRASLKVPGSSLNALASQKNKSEDSDASIVGFWHVVFTSEGTTNPPIPDGAVVDNGFAQWHSDQTEIMNSSRPPATGNFCLGVWEKTGRSTYVLNHFALSFNPDGSMMAPPISVNPSPCPPMAGANPVPFPSTSTIPISTSWPTLWATLPPLASPSIHNPLTCSNC